MAFEKLLFSSSDVQIYPSKVTFYDKTYFISNITAVSIKEIHRDLRETHPNFVRAIVVFLISFFGGLFLSNITGQQTGLYTFLVIIISSVIYGIYITSRPFESQNKSPKTNYVIVLDSNSGRMEAYKAADIQTANEIRVAIEEAVTLRP